MSQSKILTDAQRELMYDLDDVAEHVSWEFDPSKYDGISTIGFARIARISGNSSFYRRLKSLAKSDIVNDVQFKKRGPSMKVIQVNIGALEFSVRKNNHKGGFDLSITNTNEFRPGPEHQRLDVREKLHSLVLQRLRYNGYEMDGARVVGRMD